MISPICGILKNDTNELICNTETLTDTENKFMLIKGEREWTMAKLTVWDQQIQTTVYKADRQQGSTIQFRELYSVSQNKTIIEKNIHTYIYIYIIESFYCTLETNTTL